MDYTILFAAFCFGLAVGGVAGATIALTHKPKEA